MWKSPELNIKQEKVIKIAEEALIEGTDTGELHGFEFGGIWIVNPFVSENGMETVNPEDYYGKQYIEWYKSL